MINSCWIWYLLRTLAQIYDYVSLGSEMTP